MTYIMSIHATKRYEKNPFTEELDVPVATRQVKVAPMGKDSHILVNEHTGESRGTHVTTYKKVDAAEFVKLFTANIAMTFELNSAGIKTFNILMWMMQKKAIQKDLLVLDKYTLDEFLEAHADRKPAVKMSMSTFKRGLNELEEAQIIAKNLRSGWYFINPNFAFNGDRIAFSTIIEKDKDKDKVKSNEEKEDKEDES